MKTTGTVISEIHKLGHAALRRTPKLRLAVRHAYWGIERQKYDALAEGVPVDSKLVFFEAYGGRSYACSPKAIYETMLRDSAFEDYRFVWSFNRDNPHDDVAGPRTTTVARGSETYFQALAKAGTIVMNNRLPEYVTPKPDQAYVQCWHGTPLKRLGYDVVIDMHGALNTASELAERFGMDARKWTYLLSPSPFTSQHLADAFGLPESRRGRTVLELGYPRNDALQQLGGKAATREALRRRFGIPQGKKALLYAPTWRDDSYQNGLGYTFDYLLDFDALQDAIGQDWTVLFRPHYYIANSFDFSKYGDFVVNAAGVDDVNDLYLAADALLTDYSSVMFDYANLDRPIVLYVPDIDHYANDIRGFYFDIRDVPGPLCTTTAEVAACLADPQTMAQGSTEAYRAFKERFCPIDDGHAAERVIARVFG